MQMNAWSYEPVSSKKQIKDNLKIEPSIKVYTNLAKASECACNVTASAHVIPNYMTIHS